MLPSNLRNITSALASVALLVHTHNTFFIYFFLFLYTDTAFSIPFSESYVIISSLAIHILLPIPLPKICNFVLYLSYNVKDLFGLGFFWLKFFLLLGIQLVSILFSPTYSCFLYQTSSLGGGTRLTKSFRLCLKDLREECSYRHLPTANTLSGSPLLSTHTD